MLHDIFHHIREDLQGMCKNLPMFYLQKLWENGFVFV